MCVTSFMDGPLRLFRPSSRKFLVCGIFGQNFHHKPERRWRDGISTQPEEQEGASEGKFFVTNLKCEGGRERGRFNFAGMEGREDFVTMINFEVGTEYWVGHPSRQIEIDTSSSYEIYPQSR